MKILFPFRLMPNDISGGGFVDYETNTCIKANLRNLKLKVNQLNLKCPQALAEMKDFRRQLRSRVGLRLGEITI